MTLGAYFYVPFWIKVLEITIAMYLYAPGWINAIQNTLDICFHSLCWIKALGNTLGLYLYAPDWINAIQNILDICFRSLCWIKALGKTHSLYFYVPCLLVFNATFNNISAISWRLVFLVKETGGPGENHRPFASHWQTLSHNVIHLTLIKIRTHNISGDRHRLIKAPEITLATYVPGKIKTHRITHDKYFIFFM